MQEGIVGDLHLSQSSWSFNLLGHSKLLIVLSLLSICCNACLSRKLCRIWGRVDEPDRTVLLPGIMLREDVSSLRTALTRSQY
jgi:hypothetical protein